MKCLALLIVAAILFTILAPFGLMTSIVMLAIVDSREQYVRLPDYFFAIAYSIDILGNVICGDLFNVTLVKHNSYKFGMRGETISSVLGKNIVTNTLTRSGRLLAKILDFFDSNHCIKSIQEDI